MRASGCTGLCSLDTPCGQRVMLAASLSCPTAGAVSCIVLTVLAALGGRLVSRETLTISRSYWCIDRMPEGMILSS